jgi:hypothetical protein
MNTWAEIVYRGFDDVPRIFIATHHERSCLFSCPFDEALDDYPDAYQVYLLPTVGDPKGNWEELHRQAVAFLGEVPVKDVHFDATQRRAIDTAVLDELEYVARSREQ